MKFKCKVEMVLDIDIEKFIEVKGLDIGTLIEKCLTDVDDAVLEMSDEDGDDLFGKINITEQLMKRLKGKA